MQEVLLVLVFVFVLLGLPLILSIVALVKAVRSQRRVAELEALVRRATESPPAVVEDVPSGRVVSTPVISPVKTPPPPVRTVTPVAVHEPIGAVESKEPVIPPPSPASPTPPAAPPPLRTPSMPAPEPAGGPVRPAFNLEQFMGAKLFAWAGGFVLFLALVFFLKYAFEHRLISPEIQVAIEYLLAAGMLGAGVWVQGRKGLAVLGQTLCATGVVALYAVSFAMRSYYQLAPMPVTFGVMTLVTVTAFVLAVRLNAPVVAILGLLGGFLTPVALSTGVDHPFALFGYIGLLNAGLIAVAARQRWQYQVTLAAVGTVLMQWGWAEEFFALEKTGTAMSIFLAMQALFLAAFWVAQDRDETNGWIVAGSVLTGLSSLLFVFEMLSLKDLGGQPARLFVYVAAADAGLMALWWWRARLYGAGLAGGALAFLALTVWTTRYLTPELLNAALAFYFVFAVLHAIGPVVLQRLRPEAAPPWVAQVFAVLALVLVMAPILKLPDASFAVWVCVLLLNAVVFVVAWVAASVLALIGAVVVTMASVALWIVRGSVVSTDVLPGWLAVIGGFAVLFFLAGILASKKFPGRVLDGGKSGSDKVLLPEWSVTTDQRVQVSALAVVLPFLLLIMVVARLELTDPSPVFGLAMVLVLLLLGVSKATGVDALVVAGMLATLGLEVAWYQGRFTVNNALVTVCWYAGFMAVFAAYPFVAWRELRDRATPWVMGALSGPLHFPLVYEVADQAYRNPYMGLLPAVFALPVLAALAWLARVMPSDAPKRMAILACWGGAALFFITMIFPIQFEKQWITIGWALEGVALLWWYHRVPHGGLRLVGVGLLCVAFARLALNPAVLGYYERSEIPIWNWFLYAYGLVTICLFAGAHLLAPPRDRVVGVRAPPLLYGLGTVLAFLLLNIQIADYFSTGRTLTFDFSGNFARDMTYSIAWAVFALVLLVAGIWKRVAAARYASIGLLMVTLIKLFLHDLARLAQLYRIGAFVGVALVLLAASFFYQRFIASDAKEETK